MKCKKEKECTVPRRGKRLLLLRWLTSRKFLTQTAAEILSIIMTSEGHSNCLLDLDS